MVGIDPKVYIDQYRSLQTLKPGISITKGLEHLVRPCSWVEPTRDFPLAVTFFESFFHGIRIGGDQNWMEIPKKTFLRDCKGTLEVVGSFLGLVVFDDPCNKRLLVFFFGSFLGRKKLMHCFFITPPRRCTLLSHKHLGDAMGPLFCLNLFTCFEIPKTKDLDPSFCGISDLFFDIWNAKWLLLIQTRSWVRVGLTQQRLV